MAPDQPARPPIEMGEDHTEGDDSRIRMKRKRQGRASHKRCRTYAEATVKFNIEHRRSFNKGRTQTQKVCQNPKKVRRMVRQAIKTNTLLPRPE